LPLILLALLILGNYYRKRRVKHITEVYCVTIVRDGDVARLSAFRKARALFMHVQIGCTIALKQKATSER